MYRYIYLLSVILIIALPLTGIAQSNNTSKKETREWKYEIEPVSTGAEGTYQIKVWSFIGKKNINKAQFVEDVAKRNAVHGVIFKGFAKKDRVQGQKPLARNVNLEQEKSDFFDSFFDSGGKFQKYVTLSNNGAILPGDRIKMDNEYKIGMIVSVNVAWLRKDLEDAGIIKGLGSGF